MRIFYCPKCGHFEIKRNNEYNPYKDELTVKNMLDSSFAPIQHYKCECGNYLAGYFEFITQNDIDNNYLTDENYDSFQQLSDIQKEDNILFYQDFIMNFNEGGRYYNCRCIGSSHTFDNYGEFAKWCYENNNNN